jgi:hypothetical protein
VDYETNGTIQERLGMFDTWAKAARGDIPDMPHECLEGQMSRKTRRIWANLEETYIGQMVRRDWNSGETPLSLKCDIIKVVLLIENTIQSWDEEKYQPTWQRYGPQDAGLMDMWPEDYRCRFKDSMANQCHHVAEWMPHNSMGRAYDIYDGGYVRCTRHMPMGAVPTELENAQLGRRRTLESRARRFAISPIEAREWDEWARSISDKPRRSDSRQPQPINVPLYNKPGPKKRVRN